MEPPATLSLQFAQFCLTGLTNFSIIPALWVLHRYQLYLQRNIITATMIFSFTYHSLDSFVSNGTVLLSEMQWHRLDNIGAGLSLTCLYVYLLGLPYHIQNILISLQTIILVILQEWQPWVVWTALIPILVIAILSLLLQLLSSIRKNTLPLYNRSALFKGILGIGMAIICFVKGLDDHLDPLRAWHGMWHVFIALPQFWLWQVHREEKLQFSQFLAAIF